ncbi:MAG: DMT family transporter [Pseudomonadota bacterium]
MTRTSWAILTLVFSNFALSLGDAAISANVHGFSVGQIFLVRSLIVLPVLLTVAWTSGAFAGLSASGLVWGGVRTLLLVGNWAAYYLALGLLPISLAASVYYTLPIFIAVFAAAILNEPLPRAGWFAIAIGFAGVLMITRPTGDGLGFAITLPLLAAALYASAMIVTRARCLAVHPLALACLLHVGFIAIGAAVLLGSSLRDASAAPAWAPLSADAAWLMGGLALAILIGSVGTAVAYLNAPASRLAIFDYAYVLFAIIWGVTLQGDRPDVIAWAGVATIVGAGVLMTFVTRARPHLNPAAGRR